MAIVTAGVIIAIITILDIGHSKHCNYHGYYTRPDYYNHPNCHNCTDHGNRYSFFSSFLELNRVLNTKNVFQGSMKP